MAAMSISSQATYFCDEPKSLQRRESFKNSDHVENSFCQTQKDARLIKPTWCYLTARPVLKLKTLTP